MTKNDVIDKVIKLLLEERKDFGYELRNINYNETQWMEKKITLEMQINNVDMNIQNRLMEMEMQIDEKKGIEIDIKKSKP